MKQLAFYAPLKSPDHPVPSGDREMAQGIIDALSMNSLGLEVNVASTLRCYDGQGDENVQHKIRAQANAEVARLLDGAENWQAWVTYHNYYKAPDLIGFAVSQRLKIPYLLIEASIAKSRASGPWSDFALSADSATNAADVVFYLTEKDRVALEKYRPEKQALVHLAPFLNQTSLNQTSLNQIDLPEVQPVQTKKNMLLTVGMHRFGDKLASYRIIADALPYLQTTDWQLSIVGDGPARADIEKMFALFSGQVNFLGQLDRVAVAQAYQQASVFVWPGVNEAFGLVYLEAQAAGLPVVAQDRAGVREVIASPKSLVPEGNPQSLARAIDNLLGDASQYQSIVQAGQDFVRNRHLLGTAAHTLSEQLSRVLSTGVGL